MRYRDADGRQHAKSFARQRDAKQFVVMREKSRVRAKLLPLAGDGIDPTGFYVYLLWAVQGDDKPLYVGQSANLLARLGAHLGNGSKRSKVGWVTYHRCASEQAMIRREGELIRRYRPPWNLRIPPEQQEALQAAS